MSWAKLDDRANEHRKQLAAGAEACWLWACGLMYANRQTARDGFIPSQMLPMLYPLPPGKRAKLVAKLLEVGLWAEVPGGYQIHDFTEWNRTKEQVEAEREATRNRVARHRANGVTLRPSNGVTADIGNAGGNGDVPDHSAAAPLPAIPDQGNPPPEDLTRRGDPLPSVVVVPRSAESGKVACPADLQLDDAQRGSLLIDAGMTEHQVNEYTKAFRTANVSNHEHRTLAAWRRSLVTYACNKFRSAHSRPPCSADEPETERQSAARLRSGPRQPNAFDHSDPAQHLAAIGATVV